jgi:hypothetical protein
MDQPKDSRTPRPSASRLVEQLTTFGNPAEKGDRLVISSMPVIVYRQIQQFAMACVPPLSAPRSIDDTIAFSIARGLPRFEHIDGIKTIAEARACVLVDRDTSALVWFDVFPFDIPTAHTDKRVVHARVCAQHRTACKILSDSLGLTQSKVVILALATVLHDAPLADDDYRYVHALLEDFAAQVKARAIEAFQRACQDPIAKGPAVARETFAQWAKHRGKGTP